MTVHNPKCLFYEMSLRLLVVPILLHDKHLFPNKQYGFKFFINRNAYTCILHE